MQKLRGFAVVFFLWPFFSTFAASSSQTYKEPLVRVDGLLQSAIYVDVDERGIGIESQDSRGSSLFTNTLASVVNGSLVPLVVGTAMDGARGVKPLLSIQEIANQVDSSVALGQVQTQFQVAVIESLSRLGFTNSTIIAKSLTTDKVSADSFNETNSLAFRLSYSLTPDVRRVHVVIVAAAYDKESQSAARNDKKSSATQRAGRVFRNRFEYFSDARPLLPSKTTAEIADDVARVEAKYANDNSSQGQRDRKKEIEQAREPVRSNEEQLKHLVAEWTADDGHRLKEEFRAGIRGAMNLFERDFTDTTVLAAPQKGRQGEIVETTADREIYRRLGEDAGVLLSWPRGYFGLKECSVRYRKQ